MILYLVHSSDKRLLGTDCLKTSSIKDDGQFPGVFLTLITSENIKSEPIFPGEYVYLFSRRLLEQSNYHINTRDVNGMLNEELTYFPWQIRDAEKKINENQHGRDYIGNEVVFHDDIPMSFCVGVISSRTMNNKYLLPNRPLHTPASPDTSLLPFYCFVSEDTYTGVPRPPPNPIRWYMMLAAVAGVAKKCRTKQEYIDAIRKKSRHLYTHRDSQDFRNILVYRHFH